MGKLRFRVPDHDLYDPRFWESAYVVSVFDEIPRPSECRFEGDLLCVDFESSETCKLSIPWPTKEFGPVVLTTTSLRSTNVPYSLRLELARGFIHRVRTCAFDWEHHLGLPIPNSYHTLMDQAMDFFIQAVIDDKQGECEEGNARRALDAAIDASRALSRTYTSKMLQIRILNGERLQTLFGVRLPAIPDWRRFSEEVAPACNSISVELGLHQLAPSSAALPEDLVAFQQLEWAEQKGLRVVAGPLLNLQSEKKPSCVDDKFTFEGFCRETFHRIEGIVKQAQGKVRLWEAFSGLTSNPARFLEEEHALRLASGLINTIKRVDPKTPMVINFDLPGAEYMKQSFHTIEPIAFAQTLIQLHDREIAGIGLELNLAYWPSGTLPRELIDLSNLIDHWGSLGKSLLIRISTPLSLEADPSALHQDSLVSKWRYPGAAIESAQGGENLDTDPDVVQSNFGEDRDCNESNPGSTLPPNAIELVNMLMAKQKVHGIIWNQCSDATAHLFPNAGLFDRNGNRRDLLNGLIRLREQYIQ